MLREQEVVGSSPVTPTITKKITFVLSAEVIFCLNDIAHHVGIENRLVSKYLLDVYTRCRYTVFMIKSFADK